jgi:N-acetylglucosamine kinase-like BadF-type ATPase
VAQLAEVALVVADEGDAVALSLVQRVIDEQTLAAETAIGKWRQHSEVSVKSFCFPSLSCFIQNPSEIIPIVLVGSLWRNSRIRNGFVDRLHGQFGNSLEIVVPSKSAAFGAALLALRKRESIMVDKK